MSTPAFIYSPRYDPRWPGHVFPAEKYRLLHQRMIDERLVGADDFLEPEPVSDEQMLLVHHRAYLDRLLALVHDPAADTAQFEAPLNPVVWDAVTYGTGGTILACEVALAGGSALNLSGGFHHAFPDHGEGFCFINDVAVAIRVAQQQHGGLRVGIVDCDLHQGNGTAFIFRDDDRVVTLSIHQENIYPPKERGDVDVGLPPFTGDEEYLSCLRRAVGRMLNAGIPDLIVYLAGADPYEDDKLGDLMLTKDGLRQRDELVIATARNSDIPIAVVLAGGYASDTNDVVDIHFQTAEVLARNTDRP